jgi:hypothetical protein
VVLDADDRAAFDREDVVDLASALEVVDREVRSAHTEHDVEHDQ